MTTPVADWGAIVVETDVDRAVIERLALWMPTYLTQTERSRELPGYLLARPDLSSYQNALEDDTFPDGRLPAIVVTTARTDTEPEPLIVGIDDAYSASWRTGVSAIVRGRTPAETREYAALYGGCVRAILAQQQTDIGRVRWTGSAVVPYPDASGQGRFLAAAMNQFTVFVEETLTGEGPLIADAYPLPDPAGNPDELYDPLAVVRAVTTEIRSRS